MKSSSECSTSDNVDTLTKKLEKIEKRRLQNAEKKERQYEKKKLKAHRKELQRKKKIKKRRSRCTCFRDIKRVTDKCCPKDTSLLLKVKCQSTSPMPDEQISTESEFQEQVPSATINRPRKIKNKRSKGISPPYFLNRKRYNQKTDFDENGAPIPPQYQEQQIDEQLMDPETHDLLDDVKNPQMILNRNINIYLQVEKFCKQKPILLSRRQYEKVKKIIEGKIGNSSHRQGWRSERCCACSVGDVREKEMEENKVNDINITTNVCTISKAGQADLKNSLVFMTKEESVLTIPQKKSIGISPKQSSIQKFCQTTGFVIESNKSTEIKVKKTQCTQSVQDLPKEDKKTQCLVKVLASPKENTKKTQYIEYNQVPPKLNTNIIPTEKGINYKKSGYKGHAFLFKCAQCGRKTERKHSKDPNCSNCMKKEIIARCEAQQQYMDNLCNICRMLQDLEGDIMYPVEKQKSNTRRAASSAEIHYANINTSKRVTFSSTFLNDNFLRPIPSSLVLEKESSNTLYTLFKGRYEFDKTLSRPLSPLTLRCCTASLTVKHSSVCFYIFGFLS